MAPRIGAGRERDLADLDLGTAEVGLVEKHPDRRPARFALVHVPLEGHRLGIGAQRKSRAEHDGK